VTWPGESLEYYDAADGADLTLYGDIYFRTSDGRTIASGDVWRVWYRADWQVANRYLTDAGADVEVSWVVEVAGGSGTLSASETVDLSPPDTSAAGTTSLGSYVVSGAGTVVIPSSLMGASEIVDGPASGRNMLRLECTAGSIDVQQIKIRVWPPGGPVGGWVDKAGWNTADAEPTVYRVETTDTTYHTSDAFADSYEGSWDASMAGMIGGPPIGSMVHSAFPGSVFDIGSGFNLLVSGGIGNQTVTSLTPFEVATAGLAASTLAVIVGSNWESFIGDDPALGANGVDWWRPPTEVAGDTAVLFPQTGTGSTNWSGATGLTWSTDATPGGDEPLGAVTLYATALDDVPIEVEGSGPSAISHLGPVTVPAGTPLTMTPSDSGSDSLPTGGRYLLLVLSHTILTTTYSHPGTAGGVLGGPWFGLSGEVTVGALRTYATMPGYQVWHVEGASPIHPLRLMQRGDALGMGSGRILGAGTRQGSLKVFGSL
jgi:hypothetical protein